MSKKMLKRSLALGALMAFVITGSAYADDLIGGKNLSYATELSDETTISEERTTGVYDDVIGAHYYGINMGTTHLHGKNTTSSIQSVTTKLSGDIEVVESVFGGSKIAGGFMEQHPDSPKVDFTLNTAVTSLTIDGGKYGTIDTSKDKDFRKVVTAGDFIKERGLNYGNVVKINSNIEESNLTINNGEFDSVVYGGSVIGVYAYQNVNIGTNVKESNITITGGKFNAPVVAGGASFNLDTRDNSIINNLHKGSNITNIVETVNLKITGGEFYNNIYAGGVEGVTGDAKPAIAPIASVGTANIDIIDAEVDNVYGYNVIGKRKITDHHDNGSYGYWEYSHNVDKAVNTNLTLNNATANTVDLPQGTLTLKGANNVENVIIGEKVTNVKVDSAALGEGYSLQGNGNLLVKGDKTTLTITGITTGTYNIASGYATNELEKIAIDNESSLLKAEYAFDEKNNAYKVVVSANDSDKIATNLGVTENTGNFVKDIITGGNDEAKEFLDKLTEPTVSNEVRNDTLNAVQKMGEAGGNSATAASIVKNVTGVTNDRLSFNCGHSAPHKGGHGVGLFEEGSGADVWVEYVHGKDEVEDMPSTAGASSYEGQYNGLVMGVDFKKVGKFQSGIAFNYGEGDTNSVGSAVRTHSDYDFWGVGYYGNIHNDDSNFIFDISYAQTDSDVTQNTVAGALEASPETTTWSAGVKLEKLYQNENVQIVPYTGLRYMSIDSDDYATKGGEFYYSMDRQDIWLLPLGVSIRQEIQNDNGWTVSPRVDLSYIWAFGDTNSNMEVKVGNGITPIGYDVMDDGSFLGLVGIEAHKGQWGYGIAYSYQKGDHSESKKWYVDVNYSF